MAEKQPKLFKQILEIRYDRGFRYFDRCGEVLLILDDLLPKETEKVWITKDPAPSGAQLKCPDLDMTVIFDTTHLVIDQESPELFSGFGALAETLLAVLTSRLDLRTFSRLGYRTMSILPASTIDDADKMSVRMSPISDWPFVPGGWSTKQMDVSSVVENTDGSAGIRVRLSPGFRFDAPIEIDERLKLPPRHLPTGQREALINQLRRKKMEQDSPPAGLVLDIDNYQLRPPKIILKEFFEDAGRATAKIIEKLVLGNSK